MKKVVQAGPWDMDTDATFNVAHGIPDWKRIKSVYCSVWGDADTEIYSLTDSDSSGDASTYEMNGVIRWQATNITLGRKTGGMFDSAVFSASTVCVTIWHEIE